jgi:REP element-mobilizing transposase RayT
LATPEANRSEQDVLAPATDRESPPAVETRRAQPEKPAGSALRDLLVFQRSHSGDTAVKRPESPLRVEFERVSRRPYDLSYACLLIPRFKSHRLTGDVVEVLNTRMRQVCVSFGWRPELILVRPEFLQWVISAPASMPPSRCIQIVREQTSKKILEEFPAFKEDNLSQDFWAPGYLALVGMTPHPPEMIIEFIRLTRQRQGVLLGRSR